MMLKVNYKSLCLQFNQALILKFVLPSRHIKHLFIVISSNVIVFFRGTYSSKMPGWGVVIIFVP